MNQIEKYPQLKWLVPTILFLLIFIMAARTPLDSDMWWQMKSGEVTLNQNRPLTWDVFTHTVLGKDWVNHAWLGQVILFAIYRTFSFAGITGIIAFAAAVSMILIFYQMDSPYFFRAFVIIAFSLVAAPVWTPRPQLFSLLLFAFLTYLLYLYRIVGRNYLFCMPILFLIWSNTHGGYTLGFLLLFSILVGEGINWLLDYGSEAGSKQDEGGKVRTGRSVRQLILWSFVSIFAVLINANGYRIFTIPFQTINIGVLQDFIPEWASPDFHNLVELPFVFMLIATIGAIGLSGKRMDGVEVISLGLFGAMALLARRNFGPFAIVAAPIFGKYAWITLQRIRPVLSQFRLKIKIGENSANRKKYELPPFVQSGMNFLLVFLLVSAAFIKVNYVTSSLIMDEAMAEIFPIRALEWLKSEKPPGNLFNDYNWGGFLIWDMPDYPVYVDGRTDLFGDEFLQEYLETYNTAPGWQTTLNKYDVRIVLVSTKSPLSKSLSENPSWEVGYQDSLAILLLKISP